MQRNVTDLYYVNKTHLPKYLKLKELQDSLEEYKKGSVKSCVFIILMLLAVSCIHPPPIVSMIRLLCYWYARTSWTQVGNLVFNRLSMSFGFHVFNSLSFW